MTGPRPAGPTLLALLIAAGCSEPVEPETETERRKLVALAPASPLVFHAQALPFRYERGESGVALPVETTGGGVGLIDHDGDGDLDLFFAQGVPLKPGVEPGGPNPGDTLLRNDGGGSFTDVSAAVGLGPRGYGQGVATADYDGDGDVDVYVTRYGRSTLWRNDGGRFTDATDAAGVGVDLWTLGAAFADLDADGDLDLFVATYFAFDPAQAPFLRDEATGAPLYGAPADFPGQPDVLFRNNGDGTFTDITATAGVAAQGRGMAVLAADLDADTRIDLLVANDAEANAVWRNRGDGTFEEVAAPWGLAFNGQGLAEANMGIARGDTDGDGLQDIVITHFYDEHDTLWRAQPTAAGAFYRDATFEAGLGVDSRPCTGWGTALADFDHDGQLDLVVVNGHIRPEPTRKYRYENPPLLWHGGASGRFRNVTAGAGPFFREKHQARGLACGDLDRDGDLDLVVVRPGNTAVALWNESPAQGQCLVLDLIGAAPNRDAIGAVVTVAAGGRTQVRSIDGGGSYLSASDRRIHVGLGPARMADRVEVRWPGGRVETRERVTAGRAIVWREGEGTP